MYSLVQQLMEFVSSASDDYSFIQECLLLCIGGWLVSLLIIMIFNWLGNLAKRL